MFDTKTYKSKIETVNETSMLRTMRKYYQNFPAVLTEWYTIVLLVTSLGCSNSVYGLDQSALFCAYSACAALRSGYALACTEAYPYCLIGIDNYNSTHWRPVHAAAWLSSTVEVYVLENRPMSFWTQIWEIGRMWKEIWKWKYKRG